MYQATLTVKSRKEDDFLPPVMTYTGGFYNMPQAGEDFTFYCNVYDPESRTNNTYSMTTKVSNVVTVAGGYVLTTPDAVCNLTVGTKRAKPRRR